MPAMLPGKQNTVGAGHARDAAGQAEHRRSGPCPRFCLERPRFCPEFPRYWPCLQSKSVLRDCNRGRGPLLQYWCYGNKKGAV